MRPVYLFSKTPYPGVIHIPVLSIRFLHPDIDFSRYDGVIFTSKQAIEAAKHYDLDWERMECLCVSEPTAQWAREAGAKRLHTASGYGVGIPAVLARMERSLRWLYLRPETVATDWAESARRSGFSIDEAVVYETACSPDAAGAEIPGNAVLVFTSPSSVRCYLKHHPLLDTHTAVAIGTTTAKAFPDDIEVCVSEETTLASAVKLACQIASGAEKQSFF